MDKNIIDDLARQLSDAMPSNLSNIKDDLEKQAKSTLQAQFAKLDLVTREEFDIQSAVLARTREKLEALERQVALMEKLVLDKDKG